MRVRIYLETLQDAYEIARIAGQCNGHVIIRDGKGMAVNAKSVLGAIYSMEFDELWLESDENIFSKISRFVKI